MLDPQTLSYVRDTEIGAVKVDAPSEAPLVRPAENPNPPVI